MGNVTRNRNETEEALKDTRKWRHGAANIFFSPTAESFGVSAQIGSGVVGGGPEVRFQQGSTRVPRGFHEVLRGLRGSASTKEHRMLLGISPELILLCRTWRLSPGWTPGSKRPPRPWCELLSKICRFQKPSLHQMDGFSHSLSKTQGSGAFRVARGSRGRVWHGPAP